MVNKQGNKMSKYDLITKTAKEVDPKWTNGEVVRFHYFNENGLCAAKRKIDDEITIAVDEGRARSGAHIAYGGLNSRQEDIIRAMLANDRVNRIKLAVALDMLRDDIRNARIFLDSIAVVKEAA
jgi:hypothetical protein